MVALLTLLEAGDHLVSSKALYGGTYSQFDVTFRRMGIDTTFVDIDDLDALAAAIGLKTKAVYAETLGNPLINVLDIEAVAFDPTRLADEVIQSAAALATTKDIRLSVENGNLPAGCMGDPMRISQVLLSLLSNAIKFTPAGGSVRLSVAGVALRLLPREGEVPGHPRRRRRGAADARRRARHAGGHRQPRGRGEARRAAEAHRGRVGDGQGASATAARRRTVSYRRLNRVKPPIVV